MSPKIPSTIPHRLSAERAYRVFTALVNRLRDSSASLTQCRYCEHANPADSQFCNACGGALHLPPHLASCLRCGTINPAKATVCCLCHDELPVRSNDDLVHAIRSRAPGTRVRVTMARGTERVTEALVLEAMPPDIWRIEQRNQR